jgi:signal transduction histidine kinase
VDDEVLSGLPQTEQLESNVPAFRIDVIAHELRSLLFSFDLSLARLTGIADRMAHDESRLVGTLQRSAVQMRLLLENLLSASTLEAHGFSIVTRATDLTEVLQEAAEVIQPLLLPREQRLILHLPAESLVVSGDGQYLGRLLLNLLHNAVKYGPPRAAIQLRAYRRDDTVVVTVHDHGQGIPPEEQALLFNRFFRGSAARASGHGSGLGLTIAMAIVQAHGGEIGVRSAPGSGTTFWFSLPLG